MSRARPAGSNPRRACAAERGSCQAASGTVTAPMNRFTRNTQRQPSVTPAPAMIRPPSSGPSAVDTPMVAPSTPNALERCGPVKDSWMVAEMAG